MIKMPSNNRLLYLVVLALLVPTAVLAMGGGLWGQADPWRLQWQHQIFSSLCHQVTGRSFWINGQPMAVCSRCFGIYAGLACTWAFIPLIPYSASNSGKCLKWLLMVLAAVNVVDVFANLLGIWQNTLLSRMILGVMLSGSAVAFIGTSLMKVKKRSQHNYQKSYG